MMPTYEYACDSCGFSFEKFQSMADDPLKVCPECGKNIRRVIHGGSGVIFKGSGFYVNDAKKKSGPACETCSSGGSSSGCPASSASKESV
jgi:putative FmdB family regulatory protein